MSRPGQFKHYNGCHDPHETFATALTLPKNKRIEWVRELVIQFNAETDSTSAVEFLEWLGIV
jgi:hypothetical protein